MGNGDRKGKQAEREVGPGEERCNEKLYSECHDRTQGVLTAGFDGVNRPVTPLPKTRQQ